MIGKALSGATSLVHAVRSGCLVLVVALAVAACASPEVTRSSDGEQPGTEPPAGVATTPATTQAPPSPVVTVDTVTVAEPIPFGRVSVEDPTVDAGVTAVTTVGVDGARTLTYEVVLIDGVESSRELVSDVVTVEPVDEVTEIGTYRPPPPPPPEPEPEPEQQAGCDSNYDGGCVPIDSDVDCAGGSGNGPSYVTGPVTVVGTDVYGLDRDSDGIGCED